MMYEGDPAHFYDKEDGINSLHYIEKEIHYWDEYQKKLDRAEDRIKLKKIEKNFTVAQKAAFKAYSNSFQRRPKPKKVDCIRRKVFKKQYIFIVDRSLK